MKKRTWSLSGLVLVVVLGTAIAAFGDPAPLPEITCFIASGAGTAEANGLYTYASGEITEGIETREYVNVETGAVISGYAFVVDDQWNWSLTLGGEHNLLYHNSMLAPDLALTGWQVIAGEAPAPTLRLCNVSGPVMVPTGDIEGSLLDRALELADGEAPPMIGLSPLAAIYTIGDIITGGSMAMLPGGTPTSSGFVHAFLYTVDVAPRPEVIVLLDHWLAPYNRDTREFEISYPTSELAPGYYDLRFTFSVGAPVTYRIQLIPATD